MSGFGVIAASIMFWPSAFIEGEVIHKRVIEPKAYTEWYKGEGTPRRKPGKHLLCIKNKYIEIDGDAIGACYPTTKEFFERVQEGDWLRSRPPQ